jgi:hypothetical protein
MTIQKPDDPAFGCILYKKSYIMNVGKSFLCLFLGDNRGLLHVTLQTLEKELDQDLNNLARAIFLFQIVGMNSNLDLKNVKQVC